MIVKCKECGQEYEIKWVENKKNYQCECGGELRNLSFKEQQQKSIEKYPSEDALNQTKTNNIPWKKIKRIIFLIILFFGALICLIIFLPLGIIGFAIFLYVLTEPNKKMMTCPDCGKKISKKAKTCPKCGHPF